MMRQRLLNQLHEVNLSPAEAGALLERVKTHTSSAAERERLARLIRVTTAVTEHIRAAPDVETPPVSQRLSPKQKTKRQRQLVKAARRRQRR